MLLKTRATIWQVLSIFSRWSGSGFAVVVRFVILCLFSKILGKVTQDCCGISWPSLERRNTTRTAPSTASLDANDDVLIEETTLLKKPDCRLRRELINAKLTHADQIAEPLCFFRLGEFEKRDPPHSLRITQPGSLFLTKLQARL